MILHIMLIRTHQDNYSSCGICTGRDFSSLYENETLSGAPQSDFALAVGKFFILSELWCKNDTLVSAGFFCIPEFICRAHQILVGLSALSCYGFLQKEEKMLWVISGLLSPA